MNLSFETVLSFHIILTCPLKMNNSPRIMETASYEVMQVSGFDFFVFVGWVMRRLVGFGGDRCGG